jgi:hypothetical protein
MVDSGARTVLVVVGDSSRAVLVLSALFHPAIKAQVATNEQEILAALKQNRFDLSVVGGYIGRRDPLVICEAVRVRQQGLRVLVLIGTEITPEALLAHRQRQLEGVSYADLGPTWDQAKEQPSVDVGDAIRQEVLATLGLTDDGESHQAWVNQYEAALSAAQNQATEIQAMPASPAYAPGASAPTPSIDTAPAQAGPPLSAPPAVEPPTGELTDEDFAFAARMAEQTRAIDFRTPFVPSKTHEETGAERTVLVLRDKVKELERNLARMAAVYAKRAWTFDAAEGQIRSLEAIKASLAKDHERLRQHVAEEKERAKAEMQARTDQLKSTEKSSDELQARVVELTNENSQLNKEVERREQARAEMERTFTAMLKQAQDAFNALRDQSTRALGDYERQLQESRQQAQNAQNELANLTEEVGMLRQRVQTADGEAPRIEQAILAERTQFLSEKQQWSIREAEINQQLAATRAALEEGRGREANLQRNVEQTTAEVQRLQQEIAQNAAVVASAKAGGSAEQHALEQKWLAKFEQIRQAVINLRATQTATEENLRVKETELVSVQTRLQSREEEINQLQRAHKDVTDALARERVGYAEAMEAKLDALERFARETSERMVRLVEALASLDQMARRQEVLTEQLLSRGPVLGLNAPLQSAEISSPLRIPTDAKAQSLRRATYPPLGRKAWTILRNKRSRIVLIGAGALALLLIVIFAVWPESTPRRLASPARPVSVAPAPVNEAKPPAVAAPLPPEPPVAQAEKAAAAAAKEAVSEPEAVAAPAAATAAEAEPKMTNPVCEAECKVLRQQMMSAFKKKRWADAVKAGEKIRESTPLDWEAELTLGRAEQAAGKLADAAETYMHFAGQFPSNKFSTEATISAARILASQGKKAQARVLLQHLAESGEAGPRAKAQAALRQLGGK